VHVYLGVNCTLLPAQVSTVAHHGTLTGNNACGDGRCASLSEHAGTKGDTTYCGSSKSITSFDLTRHFGTEPTMIDYEKHLSTSFSELVRVFVCVCVCVCVLVVTVSLAAKQQHNSSYERQHKN